MSIYILEGNIGSGKTTLLSQLEKEKNIIIIYEEVDRWIDMKDEDGKNIIQKFYEDKKRHSYLFQTYVLMTRVSKMMDILNKNKNSIIICERSHYTDMEIFVRMLKDNKEMTELEWNIYVDNFELMKKLLNIPIKGVIYNRVSIDKCFERIQVRGREGEENISIEYLKRLDKYHDDWLLNRNDIPILIIDGSVDIDSIERKEQIKRIVRFIQNN